MSDEISRDEFEQLSAGHALGALSHDDERAFAAALAAHPEWTSVADADAATAAMLADVEPVEAPAELRARLLAQIGDLPQTDAAVRSHEAPAIVPLVAHPTTGPAHAAVPPTRRRRVWFALAASLALLLAVGAGSIALVTQLTRPVAVVALDRIMDAPDAQEAVSETADGGVATLHWSESVGEAVLVSDGLPELQGDQEFELWFVRDGEPISAGVFAADGQGSASALLMGSMEPGDVVAVTIEPEGGSPSGVPTSDPIVAIPTA